jgi:hypothetical protein
MTQYGPAFASEIIQRHWSAQSSLTRSRGANAEEVAAFQAKYSVALPDDFAAYIKRLNGLAVPKDPGSWKNVDAEGFEFYPLSCIYQAPQSPGYYVFCRWSLGLLPFAIRLGPVGPFGEIVTLRGEPSEPYFVASNFSSFADLYVKDSSQLYECGPRAALAPEA